MADTTDNRECDKELKEGIKYDADKPRMDLLCPYAIEELSKVLTFGATKYAPWNWAKGIKTSRLIAALLRHTFAYARGEDVDPETGLHHMAHAMCCAMFIVGMPNYAANQDDRWRKSIITTSYNPPLNYKVEIKDGPIKNGASSNVRAGKQSWMEA